MAATKTSALGREAESVERESLVGEGREGEELLGWRRQCPGWGRVGLSKCAESESPPDQEPESRADRQAA